MPDNKGARRRVQSGALAPLDFAFRFCRTLFSIHAQSLAQRRRQYLFYRVKYDSRFWCSTSRQKTEMSFNPSLVSEFPPPEKILRPPMPDKDSHSIAQTSIR